MPPPDRPLRDALTTPADSIAEGMARDVSPYARSLLDELRANQSAMAEMMRVPPSLMARQRRVEFARAMSMAPPMPPAPPKRAPAPEKMQPGAPLKRRRSVKVEDDGQET